MISGTFTNVKISGVACAVPERVIKASEHIEEFGSDVVEKFVKMVGVKERHVSDSNQTSSDLCFVAAKNLMQSLNWEPSSIDALIFVTQTPDYLSPSTACVLHKRLGISENCVAFDINLGCSGYVYGLFTVGSIMQSPAINRVLLLVGETSEFISTKDKAMAMMFGDAGSATALEKTVDSKINYLLKTDGNRYDTLIVPAGRRRNPVGDSKPKQRDDGSITSDFNIWMNGQDVFNFTMSDVPKAFKEFYDCFGVTADDFDFFIPHQANLFIQRHLAKKIKVPLEKMPVSIDRYGNTSNCSIPITLIDMCTNNKVGDRLKLLVSGFGVGLSWGVVSFEVDSCSCLPMIQTNDYYLDAFRP